MRDRREPENIACACANFTDTHTEFVCPDTTFVRSMIDIWEVLHCLFLYVYQSYFSEMYIVCICMYVVLCCVCMLCMYVMYACMLTILQSSFYDELAQYNC